MIQRKILDDIRAHLSKREISLIIGPRQAGKTTLMMILKEGLSKEGIKTLFSVWILNLTFHISDPKMTL